MNLGLAFLMQKFNPKSNMMEIFVPTRSALCGQLDAARGLQQDSLTDGYPVPQNLDIQILHIPSKVENYDSY